MCHAGTPPPSANSHVILQGSNNFLSAAVTFNNAHTVVGLPMVEHCMAGYNSSIFAYGQTGAGKTHTMLGHITASDEEPSNQASSMDLCRSDTARMACWINTLFQGT